MATVGLDALRVFQVVAQLQSFTKAAARLRLDKSHVSRTVRALELSLTTVLLVRSTRSVRLTAEGEALLHRVAPLLAGLEQAVAAVPDGGNVPAGEVVVTTTPDLGRAVLAPALVGFRARYPAVRVRVELAQELVDLMRAGVDLALRVGRPGSDGLVARKVGALTAGFFASPSYLARRKPLTGVQDLAAHDGLWPTPPKGQRAFAPGNVPIPPAIACNDFGLLAELARAGAGVALLPTFLVIKDVATGALQRVLPDFALGGAPLFLVSRPLRPLPPRVAALRTFLLDSLRSRAA